MLEGLRSQIYQVADLAAAKAWYAALLGTPPYFDEPFYVGFNVGGYELGLQPLGDADAAYARLLVSGASEHQPVQDVGGGIRLGAVRDPQGNVLGVIENSHFTLSEH